MGSFYNTIYRIDNIQRQFNRLFSNPTTLAESESAKSFQEELSDIQNSQNFRIETAVEGDFDVSLGTDDALNNLSNSVNEEVRGFLKQTANKYELPEALLTSVAKVESDFNPNAVSHKGAMGVMQIMPDTANSLGLKNPFSASENIDAGARLIKKLLGVYKGDLVKTLAAYNAGEKAVNEKRFTQFAETNDYVKKVLKQYLNYNGVK